jgi:type IV secretory pathway VirB4 component
MKINLSEDKNYIRLKNNIKNGVNTLILGRAGTGKSTLINYLLND